MSLIFFIALALKSFSYAFFIIADFLRRQIAAEPPPRQLMSTRLFSPRAGRIFFEAKPAAAARDYRTLASQRPPRFSSAAERQATLFHFRDIYARLRWL